MSIDQLKARLRDVPGIETLTMTNIAGRSAFGFNGLIAAVDPNASDDEIETAIRYAVDHRQFAADNSAPPSTVPTPLPFVSITEPKPMTTQPGSFSAAIKAMMDEARAGVAQARTDGLAKVGEAIGKLNDAKTATSKVAATMAGTIEDEAASVMSELGQISNDLGA